MEVSIDLNGIKTGKEVLLKFGEVFDFGGPDGNIPATAANDGKGWGINWDAFNDCFRSIEDGGIWGTSKKFPLPLTIKITNFSEFKEAEPKSFDAMESILKIHNEDYAKEGKVFKVEYSS